MKFKKFIWRVKDAEQYVLAQERIIYDDLNFITYFNKYLDISSIKNIYDINTLLNKKTLINIFRNNSIINFANYKLNTSVIYGSFYNYIDENKNRILNINNKFINEFILYLIYGKEIVKDNELLYNFELLIKVYNIKSRELNYIYPIYNKHFNNEYTILRIYSFTIINDYKYDCDTIYKRFFDYNDYYNNLKYRYSIYILDIVIVYHNEKNLDSHIGPKLHYKSNYYNNDKLMLFYKNYHHIIFGFKIKNIKIPIRVANISIYNPQYKIIENYLCMYNASLLKDIYNKITENNIEYNLRKEIYQQKILYTNKYYYTDNIVNEILFFDLTSFGIIITNKQLIYLNPQMYERLTYIFENILTDEYFKNRPYFYEINNQILNNAFSKFNYTKLQHSLNINYYNYYNLLYQIIDEDTFFLDLQDFENITNENYISLVTNYEYKSYINYNINLLELPSIYLYIFLVKIKKLDADTNKYFFDISNDFNNNFWRNTTNIKDVLLSKIDINKIKKKLTIDKYLIKRNFKFILF